MNYVSILLLSLITHTMLSGAHYSKKQCYVTRDTRSKSITYTRSWNSDIIFMAKQTDSGYKACLEDRGDELLDIPSQEEALKQFWILATEYAVQQAMLEKLRPKKTCIKKDDRENRIITYTQEKDGVKQSATRMLTDNGREVFGSSVSGADDRRTAQEIFEALKQIHDAQNAL